MSNQNQKEKESLLNTELANLDINQFEELISDQMIKVGYTKNPSQKQAEVLFKMIKKFYGHYTHQQIDDAFSFAVFGALALSSKEIECYDFSCHYFGKIMGAYKMHLKNTGLIQSNHEIERKSLLTDNRDERKDYTIKDWIRYLKASNPELALHLIPMKIFYLIFNSEQQVAQMAEFYKEASLIVESKRNSARINFSISPDTVAKQLAIKNWFLTLKDKKL